RQEEKHPPCEDQIVCGSAKRRVNQIGLPQLTAAEPVSTRHRRQPCGKHRRTLDRIDRRASTAPELEVQRTLARTDFENLPATSDIQPVEERVRNRIPQLRLCPQPRRFSLGIAEKIFVASAQLSASRS